MSCETGCMNYHGGEVRHYKDCEFYPESLTRKFDELQSALEASEQEVARLRGECDELETQLSQVTDDAGAWAERSVINGNIAFKLQDEVYGLRAKLPRYEELLRTARLLVLVPPLGTIRSMGDYYVFQLAIAALDPNQAAPKGEK